jgi:CheY-like chemotaxis protein
MAIVILLVEDDADIRQDLAELLRDEGYSVMTASNGAEALGQLRGGMRPRLILLDLMMPVMNGWEFRVEQLKDPELASIPVVLLSGAADVHHNASTLRVYDFLTKPIQLDRLFKTLERAC